LSNTSVSSFRYLSSSFLHYNYRFFFTYTYILFTPHPALPPQLLIQQPTEIIITRLLLFDQMQVAVWIVRKKFNFSDQNYQNKVCAYYLMQFLKQTEHENYLIFFVLIWWFVVGAL